MHVSPKIESKEVKQFMYYWFGAHKASVAFCFSASKYKTSIYTQRLRK